MPKIKRLSPQEAQKIAAGEVVERPANVVKELIENAIDAGATKIDVFIQDGGKKLIRVIDNGCGMETEDAQLCFEHHATSKITTIADLDSINTFGFRGEALSSIASVSKTSLITKTVSETAGIKIDVHGGDIHNIEPHSARQGTDIAVHNLFFNVPARRKFLKKRETEWRHIMQLFHAFCLSYHEIHFTLHHDGKQAVNTPTLAKSSNFTKTSMDETLDKPAIIKRLEQTWESQITHHMLPLQEPGAQTTVQMSGAISNHQFFRYDRSFVYFFVNNRWVKNHQLGAALLKGYQSIIPGGRYPAACLFITIAPHELDINMHPRKEEVQFLHPQRITNLLQELVKRTLETQLSKQIKQTVTFQPAKQQPFVSYDKLDHISPFSPSFEQDDKPRDIIKNQLFKKTLSSQSTNQMPNKSSFASQSSSHESKKTVQHNKDNQKTIDGKTQTFSIIGQYHKTYIMLEHKDGLIMIDQHAAHECILYERFSQNNHTTTVKLLFPHIVTLTKQDLTLFTPHLDLLHINGFEIEPFGADQLIINATPVPVKNIALNELIKQIIGWIIEAQKIDVQQIKQQVTKKLHAQMACKTAVKAGDTLTPEKIQKLLNDLYTTENRFTCPHGRPTSWLLHRDEIEKKFKRDYKNKKEVSF